MLPHLYSDLADLWPLISPPRDYQHTADVLTGVLHELLGPAPQGKRHSLVEFGVGAGHSLCHFAKTFDAHGVDLSPCMITLSARHNSNATHYVGDMRDVDLQHTFDAVLIHDAIEYMISESDVRKTLANAARHLRNGGVLVVSPTYVTESFVNHDTATDFHTDGGREVTCVSRVEKDDSSPHQYQFVLTLLVREHGELRVIEDRCSCGVFSRDQWRRNITEAGFDPVDTLHAVEIESEIMVGIRRAR